MEMEYLVKLFISFLLIVYVRTEKCEDTGVGCIYLDCDSSYHQDFIKEKCRKSCNLCNDVPDTLKGTWTSWNYGSCSKSCGGGTKTGQRRCLSGYCSGSFRNEVNCNTEECIEIVPIWGDWNLGVCSVTCGEGQRQDTRVCSQGDCVGSTTRWVECVEGDCPVWTDWGPWTSCSLTCGRGRRDRTRTCTGENCQGNSREWEYCTEEEHCEGDWSDWSESGSCSATCDEGTVEMTRSCLKGNCDGISSKYEACEIASCEDVTWSEWESWGSCSATCGEGYRKRSRECPEWDACGDNEEKDSEEETETCSDREICGPTPVWNTWLPWSTCTRTCGEGHRERHRSCPLDDACRTGDDYESDSCPDNHPCPYKCRDTTFFCWFRRSNCLRYPDLMKRTCARTCNLCEKAHQWSKWYGECSITCGSGGIMKQTRTCLRGECPGSDTQTIACPDLPECPATWSLWSSWTQCSTSCGEGHQRRIRACPFNKICDGGSDEWRYCQDQPHCRSGHGGEVSEVPLPKSCRDIATKKNADYTIQPTKSLPPFKVTCYFHEDTVITSVRHNSEDEMAVSPKCDEARCYKRAIEYNDVTMEQMRALIVHVGNCRQYVSYRCQGSALFRWGHAGWESWDGRMQNYWGGSNGKSGFCGCGVTRSCLMSQYKCNCDANAMIEQVDSGYLSKQDDLPVKTLYFGDTKQPGEYGFHRLGALQCIG